MKKKYSPTSTQLIALGFFLAIIIGTVLLALPVSTAKGEHTSILEALFTATTSVCVTGLVVVDTFSHFTLFGKIIILLLIQVGGLGIVSITTLVMLLFRRKFTLKNSMMMQDAYNLNTKQNLKRFTIKVFIGTLSIELIGAILYSISFCQEFGLLRGIWYAVFNAVSAFCNAGIDIIGANSLMNYSSNPLVLITTMFLIIMGGLGFIVWWDIIDIIYKIKDGKIKARAFFKSMKVQTKLVLIMTASLVILGALFIYLLEKNNPETIGNMSTGNKVLNAVFQSVTLRTAGFISFSQKGLRDATAVICMVLMFIGGSPVGTAGGVKTVTMAVIFFTFLSMIRERDEVVVFKRKISPSVVKKTVTILFVSFGAVVIMFVLLLITNDVDFVDGLYEVVSAIATVGLSRNLTSSLNSAGRIIIILCMYLGRIGPISMAIAFNSQDSRKNLLKYPEENIIVG
jgi:trk system potassium uptake protein TrkH